MSLTNGSTVGPYEILAPLGAGGMGEVYRARDPRLQREVALKVLPRDVVADRDRMARFEKEAQAASAISHPAIVAIYDIGGGEQPYIAMELVEGRTLRAVLGDGPLPLKKALVLAAQLADGLAAAHARGIIHRDLKPENLMVSSSFVLKILDFGLAKLALPAGLGEESPTLAMGASGGTRPGTVLGTVGYMAPEQARGRPATIQSDQFSLGAVLYEMVTGRRAFARETAVDTLSAILHAEPESLSTSAPTVPRPLHWIIERCLAKEADERYGSTRDLARDLARLRDAVSTDSSLEAPPPSSPSVGLPARPRRPWLAIAGVTAAVLAVPLAFLAGRRTAGVEPPSYQKLTSQLGHVPAARFAPDGKTVVYAAAWDGGPERLYTTIGSEVSRSLELPPSGLHAVSPAGELLISLSRRRIHGMETAGKLARVPLSGGAPRDLLEDAREADFLPGDGQPVIAVTERAGRTRVTDGAGAVLHETTGWISHLRVSPSGRVAAFLDHPVRRDDRGHVVLLDLAKKTATVLTRDFPTTEGLAFRPDGKEIWFGLDELVVAVPPTGGRLRTVLRAPARAVIHDVITGERGPRALVSFERARHQFRGAPPGGAERGLSWLGQSSVVDLSRDGRHALFTEFGAGDLYGAYLRGTDGSPAIRLGAGDARGLSPDGRTAVAVMLKTPPEVVLMPTGAGETRTRTVAPIETIHAAHFFPDGQTLLLAGSEPGRGVRYYALATTGTPRALTPEGTRVAIENPVSPDGTTLVARIANEAPAFFSTTDPAAPPRPIPGLAIDEDVLAHLPDGRLLVGSHAGLPCRVTRLDPRTSQREPWRELQPPEPAGVSEVFAVLATPDLSAYAYGYLTVLSELFLVEDLR